MLPQEICKQKGFANTLRLVSSLLSFQRVWGADPQANPAKQIGIQANKHWGLTRDNEGTKKNHPKQEDLQKERDDCGIG